MLQAREQIGSLDRVSIFLQKIIVDGDSNEDKIEGWEEIDTDPLVPASRKEMKGGEHALADRLTYSQTTHFVIRYRDDVTVEMRVVCESKVYEIISMQEEGRKRFLTVVTNLLDNVFYT